MELTGWTVFKKGNSLDKKNIACKGIKSFKFRQGEIALMTNNLRLNSFC